MIANLHTVMDLTPGTVQNRRFAAILSFGAAQFGTSRAPDVAKRTRAGEVYE